MGTRRSRHNKGRKPFYKEHRRYLVPDEDGAPTVERAAEQILSRRAGPWDEWYRNYAWQPEYDGQLEILCKVGADIEQSGLSLGRSPRSVAWRARELRLELPAAWSSLIAPKRIIRPNEPLLCYPYVRKAAPDHGDLLRANDLVPKGLPEHMRADICQSVILALFEGTVTLDEIEANKDKMRWFLAKFHKEQMPYQEVLGLTSGDDDERDYYDVADARASWRHEEANAAMMAHDSWRTHAHATQEEDAHEMLLAERMRAWAKSDIGFSMEEVVSIYDKGKLSKARAAQLHAMVSRADLLKQQHGKCAYCKCEMTLRWGFPNTVTRDHIVAISAGGTDDETNLVGACLECNQRKGSMPIAEFLATMRARKEGVAAHV